MRLTKTTNHAIRILIECAGANGQLINTTNIARRLDITPLHVLKIVHNLSVAGFVECTRGRNGGVRLARPADSIRIGDIVRTIEFAHRAFSDATSQADGDEIGFESVVGEALAAFIRVLDQHTVDDMYRSGFARSPDVERMEP